MTELNAKMFPGLRIITVASAVRFQLWNCSDTEETIEQKSFTLKAKKANQRKSNASLLVGFHYYMPH
ncbi:hypothetical protein [Metaplanococcus flavidus]|uniref:Uncharacterized protein n=1 Tax=Metaplanococcus flavidus TaxID=569883 RepID=A0ABW3LCJ6_9BACL